MLGGEMSECDNVDAIFSVIADVACGNNSQTG